MDNFYFTFGSNHLGLEGTPEHGKSLFKRFVKITAENMHAARAKMFAKYADKWAFCYTANDFKDQPSQFGLTELEAIN